MRNEEIIDLVFRRYSVTQTPLGRWWLAARAAARRFVWRCCMQAAHVSKRAFDVAFSSVFIVLSSPLLALIALWVKLEDNGPVVFSQIRVGKHGRLFRMYKFRSMCLDAEARLQELLAKNHHKQGVTFKLKDDPRLTHAGKWLRKFSLDELPQFFNVLKGDMSVVGPRPPLPREVALYSLADRRRLAVTPGITCLWQIGGRSEVDFSGQVNLDVAYIEHQSFWLDVKIVARTAPAVLASKGAC